MEEVGGQETGKRRPRVGFMEGRCSEGLEKEWGMPRGWLRLHAVGNAELSEAGPGERDR